MGYDEDLAPTSDPEFPPPKLSGPTLASKEHRDSSQGKKGRVTPGQGVVLVILSGNHSSQVSPITASRGLE